METQSAEIPADVNYDSVDESRSGVRHRRNEFTSDDDDRMADVSDSSPHNYNRRKSNAEQRRMSALELLLSRIQNNKRNVVLRFLLGSLMIALFAGVVYLGPLAITLCILFIQVMCFHEIITIGYIACKAHNIPYFRVLSWYFLITSDFYLFGESVAEYFGQLLAKHDFGHSFLNYHLLVSFTMYIAGFVTFVLTLKKRFYKKQFILFGITHITLLIIVLQSHLMIKSMLQGIVWFLLPSLLIICNDSLAYVFGFFLGQTPLIKLSPKKTWEGFIGAAVSTVIFGFVMSSVLARYPYMICPVQYYEGDDSFTNHCEPSKLFIPKQYHITLPAALGLFPIDLTLIPFQLHSVCLALFASLISPFAGFFASGYKRLFKTKDFGVVIPGHGGFMDRFDCQGSMGTFTYVWILTFVRATTPHKLLTAFMGMDEAGKAEFLRLLESVVN